MKSIQRAHIVVVAGSDQGLVLAARLRRMEVARVTAVAALAQAKGLCQAGDADACIVAFDDVVPDAAPLPETDAPRRRCGVPSLMMVPTVTPPSAQGGPPLRLSGDGAGLYRAPNALSPHRRRAATPARRRPPPAALARRHRRAVLAAAVGHNRQTNSPLTALFST